jgi:hypothetical protein
MATATETVPGSGRREWLPRVPGEAARLGWWWSARPVFSSAAMVRGSEWTGAPMAVRGMLFDDRQLDGNTTKER